MNKCIIAVIVAMAMAMALPNLALADDPMSETAWIKMLKKCRGPADELHRAAFRMERDLQETEQRLRGREGEIVNVSNLVDVLKDKRSDMTASINKYKKCAKRWRLSDTVQF